MNQVRGYTLDEVADRLAVSKSTVKRFTTRGRRHGDRQVILKTTRFGEGPRAPVRVMHDDLVAFVDAFRERRPDRPIAPEGLPGYLARQVAS